MNDMHDILAFEGSCTVLFEEGRDGAAGGGDVFGLEETVGVSDMRVSFDS